MARKNVNISYTAFNGVSMAQSQLQAPPTSVAYTDNIGILIDWTGTSRVGTITVEACDDDTQGRPTGTWHTVTLSGTVSVSGNTGQHEISINQFPWAWLRLRYTMTSGAGSLTAKITTKQMGG